jgi:hypothetical protein
VPLKATEECLSQQLFYRLRRGFRSQLKARSSTFDLDTPLKEILHKDQWPQVWEYEAASPVTSSPAVAKGKVVVARADGQVICFG